MRTTKNIQAFAALLALLVTSMAVAQTPAAKTDGAEAERFKCFPESSTAKAAEKPTTNTTSTQQLLDTYYQGFARKAGWETVISDDFKFIGGDMTKREPIVGKTAYIQVIKRFSQLFTAMRVKQMMVADERAYVLANYDYVFPRGDKVNGDVVELWKVKDGKLDQLTIFFDTLTFERLTK